MSNYDCIKEYLQTSCCLMNNDYVQESSMAKYIVQQYIAAAGGEHALNGIDSMYAVGKVKMVASEFVAGDDLINSKVTKMKNMKHGPGEIGGFVLWQKRPDLWSLELMVSGYKISAGSDGKVAWRQTPWQHSHASRGPPRPLRRSLQVKPFDVYQSIFFTYFSCFDQEDLLKDLHSFLTLVEKKIGATSKV